MPTFYGEIRLCLLIVE